MSVSSSKINNPKDGGNKDNPTDGAMSISVQSGCAASPNTVTKEHSLQVMDMEVNLSLFLLVPIFNVNLLLRMVLKRIILQILHKKILLRRKLRKTKQSNISFVIGELHMLRAER